MEQLESIAHLADAISRGFDPDKYGQWPGDPEDEYGEEVWPTWLKIKDEFEGGLDELMRVIRATADAQRLMLQEVRKPQVDSTAWIDEQMARTSDVYGPDPDAGKR
ncbi:hypothetical protein [Streptomyces sp. NPDC098781]|uniref:hypothetical protein n=1 Tax=Streptomyces sp. NPDC098781 TaxID=3366097 RepID=UPI0038308420